MIFNPRLSAPSNDNKWYLKYVDSTRYGYNKCIEIDNTTHSCIPNCVGYAYGRFMEEQEITSCNLSRANADQWFLYTADGYNRGQLPKLGSVICFQKRGGSGHVAIVEEIKANGDIVISNSAYNGTRFYLKTLTQRSHYKYGSLYTLQGFIYPNVEFEPYVPPIRDITKRKFPWVLYSRKLRSLHNNN